MGPIGMSSGMDINSMVSKIVDAERIPKQQRIDFERAKIDTSISAYGRLRESLDTMKNLMANFRQEKAFALRSVNTTEESVVTATATTDAIAGKYAVDVLQLAQSHKIASDVIPEDTRFGPGKLQISLGDEQFDFSLRKNSKLTDVVRAINGASDNPAFEPPLLKTVMVRDLSLPPTNLALSKRSVSMSMQKLAMISIDLNIRRLSSEFAI